MSVAVSFVPNLVQARTMAVFNLQALMDTDLNSEGEQVDGESSENSLSNEPLYMSTRLLVVQLVNALQTGMGAIASSLATRTGNDGLIQVLTQVLQQHYDETRCFQALQLQYCSSVELVVNARLGIAPSERRHWPLSAFFLRNFASL